MILQEEETTRRQRVCVLLSFGVPVYFAKTIGAIQHKYSVNVGCPYLEWKHYSSTDAHPAVQREWERVVETNTAQAQDGQKQEQKHQPATQKLPDVLVPIPGEADVVHQYIQMQVSLPLSEQFRFCFHHKCRFLGLLVEEIEGKLINIYSKKKTQCFTLPLVAGWSTTPEIWHFTVFTSLKLWFKAHLQQILTEYVLASVYWGRIASIYCWSLDSPV